MHVFLFVLLVFETSQDFPLAHTADYTRSHLLWYITHIVLSDAKPPFYNRISCAMYPIGGRISVFSIFPSV